MFLEGVGEEQGIAPGHLKQKRTATCSTNDCLRAPGVSHTDALSCISDGGLLWIYFCSLFTFRC